MNRSLYIPLPLDAAEALHRLALKELRTPKQQAARLIVDGLKQAGALGDDQPKHPKATVR